MKVLIITSKWPRMGQEIDGGCMTATNVLDSLAGYACIDLLLPEGYKNNHIPGINHIYFYPITQEIIEQYNGSNKFVCRLKIAQLVGSIVFDIYYQYDKIVILHTFHAFSICDGNNVDLQQKVVLFPMLLTPSYVNGGEDVPKEYTNSEHVTLNNVPTIITPSIFECKQLTQYYHVEPTRITIIPRFVGREFTYSDDVQLDFSSLKVCYIASIKKQKHNIKAVELLVQLLEKEPNSFLYLVGANHDNLEFLRLVNFINENRLDKHISINLNMSQSEMNDLFATCFANISVARCETFGRSLIEGLYCGLPTFVLNDTECFKTLIGNNNGVEYFDSVAEMADRIVEIFHNPTIYLKKRKCAHEFGVLFDQKKLKPILKKAILC